MADRKLDLSNLKPAQARKEGKRLGRGLGSGKGRYSGRGIKGMKSRAGSHKVRPGFEGGQMPLYMRLGKQRGSTSKDAMPIGPFRTYMQPVNLRDLEARFEAGGEVTPEALAEKGLVSLREDVKVLGTGELTKALTVSAHAFSKTAAEKIEAAGGSVTWLKPPKVHKPKKIKAKPAAAEEAEEAEPEAEAPAEEPVAEAEEAAETAEGES